MARTLAESMADDLTVFTNPDEFGQIVTHKNREGVTFDVGAVWTPLPGGGLVDDSEGRKVPSTGLLIVNRMQADGITATVIDDQGLFVIDGVSWRVDHAITVSGGFSVNVKRQSQKLTSTIHSKR